jgi:hypothetical protein
MKIYRLHHVAFAALIAASSFASGCAGAADSPEDSAEADVKKKVKPDAGNGGFELRAPRWSTADFQGKYLFDGSQVAVGGRVERSPGDFDLKLESSSYSGRTGVNVVAGTFTNMKATGLRIRFNEAVTLGYAPLQIAADALNSHARESLPSGGVWRTSPTGAGIFVLPGSMHVMSFADLQEQIVPIAEGELKEIVLPTARVSVALDAYDPAFPDASTCAHAELTGGGQVDPFRFGNISFSRDRRNLRAADGTPTAASYVVPAGPNAPADLMSVLGTSQRQMTASGGSYRFALNRLEVEDVEVKKADGTKVLVRGTVQLATGNRVFCTSNTKVGVDLPDGTYVVTSTANGPNGPVRHVETVTFP